MIRFDSYSVLDGVSVRAVGVCLTAHLGTGRCSGLAVSTLVQASAVEELGLDFAITDAIRLLLSSEPELAEYVLH